MKERERGRESVCVRERSVGVREEGGRKGELRSLYSFLILFLIPFGSAPLGIPAVKRREEEQK